MTRNAFYKAQELNNELDAINKMADIINNSTLSGLEEYKAHDDHVKRDKMVLCYMSHEDVASYNNVEVTADKYSDDTTYIGNYHLGGRILGKDVPIGLVNALMSALSEYRSKIEKEFDELTADYEDED